MDICNLLDIDSTKDCWVEDSLYMPKSKRLKLFYIQKRKLEVPFLKRLFGNELKLDITFTGKILLKSGVMVHNYSFRWLQEEVFDSNRKIKTDSIIIDLRSLTSGDLEISLLALEESALFISYEDAGISPEFPAAMLYEFLSPTYELCCEEPLYYKFSGDAPWYSFNERKIYLNSHNSVDCLTYFNCFSAGKWKKYTNVKELSIYVEFSGEAVFELESRIEDMKFVWKRWKINSPLKKIYCLKVHTYPEYGIIGLRITAITKSIIYRCAYCSENDEISEIKLGICITTYKREKTIKETINRLYSAITKNSQYKDQIKIIVIDNGSTLKEEDLPGAMLIPNRNLGGTGGFMRGLLYCKEEGTFTHCLFMDDDASCEPGSIFRSMAFLSHAKEKNLALSGAMLYENIQFLQWENGAWFDEGCHSLKRDLDLRSPENLYANELEPNKKIYGAWWFFMFPIASVKNFAFPYFIRGDDIDFSYDNNFLITSLNGVAAWQDDFNTKASALTVYLICRSHIMHHMNLPCLKNDFKIIKNILDKHFYSYNDSYMYGTAACIILAIKHVMHGPEFWNQNIEPQKILDAVAKLSADEKFMTLSANEMTGKVLANDIKTSVWPNFIKKYSFNGHLLPKWMLENPKNEYLPKDKFPNKNNVYKKSCMLVIDTLKNKKIIVKRSTSKYFSNLLKYKFLIFKLKRKYQQLQKDYEEKSPTLRSEISWNNIIKHSK